METGGRLRVEKDKEKKKKKTPRERGFAGNVEPPDFAIFSIRASKGGSNCSGNRRRWIIQQFKANILDIDIVVAGFE